MLAYLCDGTWDAKEAKLGFVAPGVAISDTVESLVALRNFCERFLFFGGRICAKQREFRLTTTIVLRRISLGSEDARYKAETMCAIASSNVTLFSR